MTKRMGRRWKTVVGVMVDDCRWMDGRGGRGNDDGPVIEYNGQGKAKKYRLERNGGKWWETYMTHKAKIFATESTPVS